ncbi:hypothetical protein PHLCEN_2v2018 [Hermanssonia centrifuga]|uniref:Uncharacterized protein n=1 Tax=Hermanssonia centrifuga TaxID=98765 RepID=A0A2R6RQB7_9APHY|nr:hypothetical protein PHLCEN_2v2018 [Hermanssonia centrifuga]
MGWALGWPLPLKETAERARRCGLAKKSWSDKRAREEVMMEIVRWPDSRLIQFVACEVDNRIVCTVALCVDEDAETAEEAKPNNLPPLKVAYRIIDLLDTDRDLQWYKDFD